MAHPCAGRQFEEGRLHQGIGRLLGLLHGLVELGVEPAPATQGTAVDAELRGDLGVRKAAPAESSGGARRAGIVLAAVADLAHGLSVTPAAPVRWRSFGPEADVTADRHPDDDES